MKENKQAYKPSGIKCDCDIRDCICQPDEGY